MAQPFITNIVRGKIDRTAYAVALMEIGRYEWPDGKEKYSRDESGIRVYRVVKQEAQRYGWGMEDVHQVGRKTHQDIFSEEGKYHKLYEERLTHHRMRLHEGYVGELAKLTDNGNALTQLSDKLYASLMDDLSDPESVKKISFRDRAFLYKEVTKLDAHVRGDAGTSGPQPVINANNVIGTLNLPDSVQGGVMAKLDAIEGETVECSEE